jgi:hypothetical protein
METPAFMTEFQQDEERPDWPEEFDESVAKLGPPLGVYHTSRRRALIKGITGLGLIAAGIVINYIYWKMIGLVIPDKFFFLLLFGPPVLGLFLIYAAWRDRGLWVLAYPTGVLRWQRGEVVSFAWGEIEHIVLRRVTKVDGLQGTGDADGNPLTAWLPVENAGSRFLGSQVELVRGDGISGLFPSSLDNYAVLSRKLQEETFRVLWPGVWERYRAGEAIAFGDLTVSWGGVHKGSDLLPWGDLREAKIVNGKLALAQEGKWRSFAEVPLPQVPNPHILFTLLTIGKPVVAVAEEEEEEKAGHE